MEIFSPMDVLSANLNVCIEGKLDLKCFEQTTVWE